ncbi:MAG: hypothetical protein WAQ24_03940 [Candidatus Saccharimonadales bacterium]
MNISSHEFASVQTIPSFECLLPALQDTIAVFTGGKYSVDELRGLENMVMTGSLQLTQNTDPETVDSVMRAREEFFGEVLGWADPDHPVAESYRIFRNTNERAVPISTVLLAQSTMLALGLNATKIVNALPAAIGLSPEGIRAKMDNLTALGLNAIKIVNAHPAAISLSPEGIRAKMDNLTALGLNATKIVNAHPATIGLSPEGIRAKINALVEHGVIRRSSELPLDSTSQISAFFMLPIESLLLYLAHTAPQKVPLAIISSAARSFAQHTLGAKNTAERKRAYLERLPKVYSVLGDIALAHAEYIKLPKGFVLQNQSLDVA